MQQLERQGRNGANYLKTKTNMAGASTNKTLLLDAYCTKTVNDIEFLLLNNINSCSNLHLPYWKYDRFLLEDMNDVKCSAEFRFLKEDIYTLHDIINISEMFTCYNSVKVTGIQGLRILLERYSYLNRYLDLIPWFGRSVSQLCMMANHVMNFIYKRWHQLSPVNLKKYADYIHQSGAPLENCCGFVDGTVHSVCRPGEGQRQLYNGHKRVHGIKLQLIVCSDGMIANLFEPIEGRRHDSFLLPRLGILDQWEHFWFGPHGEILCIYGDPAYPLRVHLQTPFRGANMTPLQISWNKEMGSAGVSVEWVLNFLTSEKTSR